MSDDILYAVNVLRDSKHPKDLFSKRAFEIAERLSEGLTQAEVAKEFSISQARVGQIVGKLKRRLTHIAQKQEQTLFLSQFKPNHRPGVTGIKYS